MEKEKKHKRKHEESDERDARKASKKIEKVAKVLGYSNDVNPFGDSNLTQPFVWGKKVDKDKSAGSSSSNQEGNGEKRLKLMDEISKVRKRREDRENELEEMERLRSEEQRLREAAQFGDWQQKEEEFLLEQTRVRSKIRLSDRREKPIDMLAKNILQIESALNPDSRKGDATTVDISKLEVEIRDPVLIIESLDSSAVDELIPDIEAYYQLSKKSEDGYRKFWDSLRTIAKRRRSLHRKSSTSIHKSTQRDVEILLGGKSDRDLDLLEADVKRGLAEGKYPDVSYWEEVLEEIELHKARSYVLDVHKDLLRKQLDILAEIRQKMRESGAAEDDTVDEGNGRETSNTTSSAVDDAMLQMAENTMHLDDSEEKMRPRDEIALPGETYWWQDQYRPRKPRYFNRIRVGWEWNKYNQTHYDHDNPPPKTIQGYKFAIFYPDLIDKSVAPKYFLEACSDKDFAVLRFHAGPPYEDVAFKILNQQWDVHRKSGFKCVFERGVMQLTFNFMRKFYRR